MKCNGRRKAKMGVKESKKGGRIKIGREGGKNLPREENKQTDATNKQISTVLGTALHDCFLNLLPNN